MFVGWRGDHACFTVVLQYAEYIRTDAHSEEFLATVRLCIGRLRDPHALKPGLYTQNLGPALILAAHVLNPNPGAPTLSTTPKPTLIPKP